MSEKPASQIEILLWVQWQWFSNKINDLLIMNTTQY